MKTLEYGFKRAWLNKIFNSFPLLLDKKYIVPLVSFSVGCTGRKFTWNPGARSLFYNGIFYMRLALPFWVGIHIRWSAARYFQCGIGWKLNGRFAVLCRVQTDASAAAGVSGPNYGQATGWDCGTK